MHKREKNNRKLAASANPPLAQASAVPIPQSNSTRKYQIEIRDLQYRHLPLSQSQLRIGMLSRASTKCPQEGQKERRGWFTVNPIRIGLMPTFRKNRKPAPISSTPTNQL